MILTLLTLATGGAVFLGARNLKASIRSSIDVLFAPQHYDLTLRLARPHAPDSIESTIARVSGVSGVEAWSAARGAVSHADGTLGNSFAIAAPPPGTNLLAFPLLAGRWLRQSDRNALVVSRSWFKDEPSLAAGSVVTLIVGGRAMPWTIVGVVDAGPSPSAYAPREVVAQLVGNGGVDLAMVRLTERGAAGQFESIQRVRTDLADRGFEISNTQLLLENRRVMEDHLLMVGDFLGGMAWLMIVVGGLGLASTMSLSVLERTREIGVMRAIGARHSAIFAMVQLEGIVIAVLSWVIALPLSLPMSVALGRAFGRIMLPVPDRYVPEGAGVAWWLSLVLVVSILACAWPAVRAMRITTRAALAYE
jgi:putative ABC transport system permease protein